MRKMMRGLAQAEWLILVARPEDLLVARPEDLLLARPEDLLAALEVDWEG